MTDDRGLPDAPASEDAQADDAAAALGPISAPDGWSDALTGTDGPRYWDRMISTERARVRRYKRSVTVAIVEVAGLDELGRLWGADVAERLFVKIARTVAREARVSDVVARVEPTRLAVLLTETNEIAAINFVERARTACEADLGEARTIVRIGLGWASPKPGADLLEAIELATDRVASDLGRAG